MGVNGHNILKKDILEHKSSFHKQQIQSIVFQTTSNCSKNEYCNMKIMLILITINLHQL